jgi:uncharacterized repeat protein (TIGR01451 family)
VDEIKYSFGDTNDSVVFDWHGTETTIYYGLDNTYRQSTTASPPSITPFNGDGHYEEATLTGLQPNTTYHYKIGADGVDHTFQTIPTGSFNWVDVGDTMSTSCAGDGTWMPAEQQLVANQSPNFVTHGGDVAVPNQCGLPSLHQYFVDQQVWSTGVAFQPVWGNHEYGAPTKNAPDDAITDVLSNYKGRAFITHAQTASNDTAKRLKHPGCGAETGSTVNTCRGEDWGWFKAGGVLFISYPEPEVQNKWDDWQAKADTLMAQAQADPSVDFVVTYGHRPAYTSSTEGPNLNIRAATQALAAKYSPNSSNPDGKYVLNVQHHAHSLEAFRPINGLTYVTDAGGGQGLTNWVSPVDPNSVYRMMHFGLLAGSYDAANHSLSVSLKCGPDYKYIKDSCSYGDTLWTSTFNRRNSEVTAQPQLSVAYGDNTTTVESNQQLTYTATATNTGTASVTAATLSATVPSGSQVVAADDNVAPVNENLSWAVGDIAPGQSVSKQFTVQLGLLVAGSNVTSTVTASSADGACAVAGSACSVTDVDTVPAATTATQYVTNQSVENDLSGWGNYNSLTSLSLSTLDSFDGTNAVQVKQAGGTQGSVGVAGFTARPRLILNSEAGKTYTASVWVRAERAGQSVTLQLKETTGKQVRTEVTLPDTAWHQVTVDYTAVGGGEIIYNVFGTNIVTGDWFLADLMSLTSSL